jgi:pilus assembly protein CpaB
MKTGHRVLIAAGAGVLTALAAFFYLKGAEKKINAQQKMAPVLVARRFIPMGKTIKADDVEERQIPEAYLQPMVISSLKGGGVRARRGVIKGEQISRTNVYEEGAQLGLGWALGPGETAVSALFSPERAAGGHILPGDRVDVLCVLDRQPGWDEPAAFPLFARVRVLAVNDRIIDAPVENQKREVPNEAILVTLGLPLEWAARMALAEEKGRLALALTSPLDTGTHTASVATLRSLKR